MEPTQTNILLWNESPDGECCEFHSKYTAEDYTLAERISKLSDEKKKVILDFLNALYNGNYEMANTISHQIDQRCN